MGDYYTLLGVDRYASQETLRRAFRSQMQVFHPDHNPGDERACTRAREVIEAYHVLSDPFAKAQYDHRTGHGSACIVRSAVSREWGTSQWIPKLMLIAVFFGVLAGAIYGGVLAYSSQTKVFRPQLDVVYVSPDPRSPAILGRPVSETNANVAREACSLASNIISHFCLETAAYAQAQDRSRIRFLADVSPAPL